LLSAATFGCIERGTAYEIKVIDCDRKPAKKLRFDEKGRFSGHDETFEGMNRRKCVKMIILATAAIVGACGLTAPVSENLYEGAVVEKATSFNRSLYINHVATAFYVSRDIFK
jgi:hypothetical protein